MQIGRDRTRLHRPTARGYLSAERQLKRKKNRNNPLKRLGKEAGDRLKNPPAKGKKSKKTNFDRDEFGRIKSCPPSPEFMPMKDPIKRSHSKPLPDFQVKNYSLFTKHFFVLK